MKRKIFRPLIPFLILIFIFLIGLAYIPNTQNNKVHAQTCGPSTSVGNTCTGTIAYTGGSTYPNSQWSLSWGTDTAGVAKYLVIIDRADDGRDGIDSACNITSCSGKQ